jgi:ABC-type branched-subunit amino acid transport system substrate-binding protein
VAAHGIPQISPTASNPNLTGSPYFFRTCPSDLQQGQAGLGYLLGTLLKGKAHPTIAVFGDPGDPYAGGLQTVIQNAATSRGATVVREDYTIGQSDFATLAQDVKAHHVDAVYFAGYAREALLLSQAMDSAGIPRSVPIMSDDGFYDPQSFIANQTQKGRFHFTSFFFPDEHSLLRGADRQRILAMEQAYTHNFLKAGTPAGGYGTSRVSADTALTYDAVRTLVYAISRLPANGVTRQGLQRVLSSIGLNTHTPAFPGVTGHIRYATPAQPVATGDPIDKAIVVMHLDTHGFSHMDRILGRYQA